MPVITYVIFRGTGKKTDFGLIKLGHHALQFAGDPVYYGWHPAPEEETNDLEHVLKSHQRAVRGMVYDDTPVFRDASQAGINVYALDRSVDNQTFDHAIMQLYNQISSSSPGVYELPPLDSSLYMPHHVNNCVTWPRTLGLDVLDKRGMISDAIMYLQKQSTCYKLDLS